MGKWQKGQSGNPGGRPNAVASIRDLARQQAPAAIKELGRLAAKAKSETARIAAIRELLDRAYGKPMPVLEEAASEPARVPDQETRITFFDGDSGKTIEDFLPSPLNGAGKAGTG